MGESVKRIMLLLPHSMAARNILYTDVITQLKLHEDADITIISKIEPENSSISPVNWLPICQPFKSGNNHRYLWSHCKFILVYILHMMVAYRFNSIHEFCGFKQRVKANKKFFPRWNEGHAISKWLGFPFAKSKFIYKILYNTLNSSWTRHRFVREQFNIVKPDKIFVVHLQIANITPYIAEARARNIPIHGMIGSWDQPSTKGSLCAGVEKILVCNERLKQELCVWHDVSEDKISVVGWPQIDIYSNLPITPRSIEKKYILCGAYSQRLGAHEPEIFEYIARSIELGELDKSLYLYIRAHPLDNDWQSRLLPLKKYSSVIIEPPSLGNIEHLSQLLRHSSVVLASAGTILLDAIAHDKPAIALAYGSVDLMETDSHIQGRYEMEHLSALMETGAIIKATDDMMLLDAIKNILQHPEQHKEEREFVRKNWLEPLDGNVSQRIADAIC